MFGRKKYFEMLEVWKEKEEELLAKEGVVIDTNEHFCRHNSDFLNWLDEIHFWEEFDNEYIDETVEE